MRNRIPTISPLRIDELAEAAQVRERWFAVQKQAPAFGRPDEAKRIDFADLATEVCYSCEPAPAPALETCVYDTFTDVDGTTLVDHEPDISCCGAFPEFNLWWLPVDPVGTFIEIVSNKATLQRMPDTAGFVEGSVLHRCASDCTVEADISAGNDGDYAWIFGRGKFDLEEPQGGIELRIENDGGTIYFRIFESDGSQIHSETITGSDFHVKGIFDGTVLTYAVTGDDSASGTETVTSGNGGSVGLGFHTETEAGDPGQCTIDNFNSTRAQT